MKTTERIGAPALGNAVGLIIALYAIDKFPWLPVDQREFIVAAAGTICIHALIEARGLLVWIGGLFKRGEE